jgi:NAD(P)-dependent dehydrogenase (short-subunit alcohol dehydrogenase family)
LRFDDLVVWVTGASRGLGRGIAEAIAAAGGNVVVSARNEEALTEVKASIETSGGSVLLQPGSVGDPAAVEATLAAVGDRYGRLDALINNAGISPHFKTAERLEPNEMEEVLETNLVATYACSRAALPLLEASGRGSVVNVSSVHGERAGERLVAYAASKGGLEMVTRTLALEWARRGVRVNSLAPGYIETDMTAGLREHDEWHERIRSRIPLGRFASIAEIVACAMFLASPISSYVTGATMQADGGWTAQ